MQSKESQLERLKSKLSHLKRKAWKPIVREGDGALTASKFAGKPWLSEGEQWPACCNCGQPMQLCVQLNLQELPNSLNSKFGNGILQLFYCTNYETSCDELCKGWEPFVETCKLIRIVQLDNTQVKVELPDLKDLFPAKLIVDWQEVDDYPNEEELEIHEVILDWSEIDLLYDEILLLIGGDKLAGWPLWVQSPEYPNCPICNQLMNNFIFQLESYDNLPMSWGDAGAGYIVQCPEHKEQVAFLWQCA